MCGSSGSLLREEFLWTELLSVYLFIVDLEGERDTYIVICVDREGDV